VNPQARLLFWLLVAATIAVDAATIVMLERNGPQSRVVYVYEALISAQLSAVCIWAIFSQQPTWWRWAGVLAAVAIASLLGIPFGQFVIAESFGLYGSYVAALALALWLLSSAKWWRKLTQLGSASWQFSLSQLLVVMTVSAMLITALRASELLFGAFPIWKLLLVLTISDVIVVIATLVIWKSSWHWIFRLAATIANAALVGVLQTLLTHLGAFGSVILSSIQDNLVPDLIYRILMASVIFAWLEIGGIVPVDRRAEVGPPAGDKGWRF
jgi:hypothetical protein